MSERILLQNIGDQTMQSIVVSGLNQFDSKKLISAMLNAAMQDQNIRAAFVAEAIERGEASPPGWITRDQFGNIDRLYDGSIVVRHKKPPWEDGVEHWKGQD